MLLIANHKLAKFVVHAIRIQYTRHDYNPHLNDKLQTYCSINILLTFWMLTKFKVEIFEPYTFSAVMLLTSFSPPPGNGRTMMIPPRKWLACTLSARSPSTRSHIYRNPGPAPDMVVLVGCDALGQCCVEKWGYETQGARRVWSG